MDIFPKGLEVQKANRKSRKLNAFVEMAENILGVPNPLKS